MSIDVCPNCFTYPTLKHFIEENGEEGDCPTCGTQNVKLVDASLLLEPCRPLMDLYEVAEFGQHYWYDKEDDTVIADEMENLADILQNEWELISEQVKWEDVEIIVANVKEDYDDTSYYSSKYLFERTSSDEFSKLEQHLRHKRRFFPDPNDYDFVNIEQVAGPFLEGYVWYTENSTWFRARNHGRKIPKTPYGPKEIGAPKPELVLKGQRGNPAGISYLYLSSDEPTVLAEVRADTGDYITVGSFTVPADLRIIDFTRVYGEIDPFSFPDADALKHHLEERHLLVHFASVLSKPVHPDEHELEYVVTQYLTEYILSKGYDGIKFQSSIADGSNLVLFDTNVPSSSSRLVHIHKSRTILGIEYMD